MSERDEMADRIKAAHSDGPRQQNPGRVGVAEAFRCRILGRPMIYEPWVGAMHAPATFSFRTTRTEVPEHLLDFVHLTAGMATVGGGKIRPIVVPALTDKYSLRTVLQCAQDANLSPDELLAETEVEVAVRPYSYTGRFSPLSGARDQTHRRLHIVAMRVNVEEMVRRFDELCARYFTGG